MPEVIQKYVVAVNEKDWEKKFPFLPAMRGGGKGNFVSWIIFQRNYLTGFAPAFSWSFSTLRFNQPFFFFSG